MEGPTVSLGNENVVSSTTPVQLTECTHRNFSGGYEVCLRPRFYKLYRYFNFLLCSKDVLCCKNRFCSKNSLCLLVSLFLVFWTFFSVIGAIHYTKWHPRFDLKDVHIRTFNVTPAGELSYDMDILIEARRFSPLRRIEEYSYEIKTSHFGTVIGASSIPGFRPIHNKTMEVSSTQRVSLLPLGGEVGELVRKDLNATGRLVIRLYIEGQIYTSLFLAMKKRGGWTCDVIVSPASPFRSQIIDRMCCKDFPCMVKGWVSTSGPTPTTEWGCVDESPTCCPTPPKDLRSTNKIC